MLGPCDTFVKEAQLFDGHAFDYCLAVIFGYILYIGSLVVYSSDKNQFFGLAPTLVGVDSNWHDPMHTI